jgi:RND family efflux transporter MFP subunit
VKRLETEAAYAKSKMERAKARIARLQQDAVIKAPFAGVIVAVRKAVGDPVEPYAPIATLADPSQIRVEATILDTDMPRLKFGQPVSITLDASPAQQFTGKVAGLSSQPTTWQGRTAFAATILFDDPALVPAAVQMGADISILARRVDQALLVPTEAIRTEGEHRYVELVNSPVGRVEIGVGLTNGPLTEVLWGLSEGDRLRLR